MEIFDSHTHINSAEFSNDRADVVARAKALDVTAMLVIGYDEPSALELEKLLQQYPQIYGALGCHPEDSAKYTAVLEKQLEERLQQPKMVAVGEIGLDYHCDVDHELQKKVFKQQIALAQRLHLPVSIHNRDAFTDCYEILKDSDIGRYGGIMHSFNGDWEWAQKFLDLGMELSYSGVVTFSSAKEVQDAAVKTPAEHLLVETDAPYLTPLPYRGQQNEPGFTRYTLEFLADLRGCSVSELAEQTYQNTKRILKINE